MPPVHAHSEDVAGGMIQIPAPPSQPSLLDCFGTVQNFTSTFIFGHLLCHEAQCRESSEAPVQSLGWEDSLEKEMATHSRLLA